MNKWQKFLRWLLDPAVYPPEAVVQDRGMCRPHWFGMWYFGKTCRVCGARKIAA